VNQLQKVLLLVLLAVSVALPAAAMVHVYTVHDHPNGDRVPPAYGLRLDDLVGDGDFTFSFDYIDGSGSASVLMEYDDVSGEIHIYGRAYGGKDIGTGWDPALSGWIDIDFTYVDDVNVRDNCAGDPGNDLYVTSESANNNGTFTLDGWGGDQVFVFSGKANTTGCSFILDNDTDSKGNSSIAGDPSQWSGSGWFMPTTSGSRDWLFVAVEATVPVEEATWGQVKNLFR
jgi:hypothetical protein